MVDVFEGDRIPTAVCEGVRLREDVLCTGFGGSVVGATVVVGASLDVLVGAPLVDVGTPVVVEGASVVVTFVQFGNPAIPGRHCPQSCVGSNGYRHCWHLPPLHLLRHTQSQPRLVRLSRTGSEAWFEQFSKDVHGGTHTPLTFLYPYGVLQPTQSFSWSYSIGHASQEAPVH